MGGCAICVSLLRCVCVCMCVRVCENCWGFFSGKSKTEDVKNKIEQKINAYSVLLIGCWMAFDVNGHTYAEHTH